MYLAKRQRLFDAWEFRPGLFAELQTFEQRDLHRYFAPSRELYDDDALTYRREVTKLVPSLPSQAGRAYVRFERVVAADLTRRKDVSAQTVRAMGSPRPKRVVTVRALAKPELNVQRLAKLLIDLAVEDQKDDGKLLKKLRR